MFKLMNRVKLSDWIAGIALAISIGIPTFQHFTATSEISARIGSKYGIWYADAKHLQNWMITLPVTFWNEGKMQGVIDNYWLEISDGNGIRIDMKPEGIFLREQLPDKDGKQQYQWRKIEEPPIIYLPTNKGMSFRLAFKSPIASNRTKQFDFVQNKEYKLHLKGVDTSTSTIKVFDRAIIKLTKIIYNNAKFDKAIGSLIKL